MSIRPTNRIQVVLQLIIRKVPDDQKALTEVFHSANRWAGGFGDEVWNWQVISGCWFADDRDAGLGASFGAGAVRPQ
jgi:hypothetical protein